MLKTLTAIRYVTPLREGGSLPAVVEADDGELYVVKFLGAGQGARALVAELVVGELARACGLELGPRGGIAAVFRQPFARRRRQAVEIDVSARRIEHERVLQPLHLGQVDFASLIRQLGALAGL